MTKFALDPRLAADTVPVGALTLSDALLSRNAAFPWLILVPRRAGAFEIIDLDAADRAALMDEIALVSAALRRVTNCDKLNVAALGNVVAQLHIHVIARYRSDAAWPNTVWGGPSLAYTDAARDALVEQVRVALAEGAQG